MENKPLYLPIGYRISALILDLFFIYGLSFGIVEKDKMLIELFALSLVLFFVSTVMIFVNYTFNEQNIIIRIPFISKKECFIDDIVGWFILTTSNGSTIDIYTKEKKYPVRISGKKIRKAVADFIYKNYQKTKIKNEEELMTEGIYIQINKKRHLHFFNDCLEVTSHGNKEKYFYKELTPKHLGENAITLIAENNKKIFFNIHQCKGRFGLFEYLIKYEWNNKSTLTNISNVHKR